MSEEKMDEMEWTMTLKAKATPRAMDIIEACVAFAAESGNVDIDLIRDLMKLGLKKATESKSEIVIKGSDEDED